MTPKDELSKRLRGMCHCEDDESCEFCEAADALDEQGKRIAALTEALRKYGQHGICDKATGRTNPGWEKRICACGLDAALAETERSETGGRV